MPAAALPPSAALYPQGYTAYSLFINGLGECSIEYYQMSTLLFNDADIDYIGYPHVS